MLKVQTFSSYKNNGNGACQKKYCFLCAKIKTP